MGTGNYLLWSMTAMAEMSKAGVRHFGSVAWMGGGIGNYYNQGEVVMMMVVDGCGGCGVGQVIKK